MSKLKWDWIILVAVVVIIIIAFWWSGIFGTSAPAQQSAATVNSVNSLLTEAIAAIDAQIAIINIEVPALSTTSSKTQIGTVAGNFQTVANLIRTLSITLGADISNAHNAGTSSASTAAAQAALQDLSRQLSNMTSQANAADENVMATSSTTATLQHSITQFKVAQTDLKAARADITTIVQKLDI